LVPFGRGVELDPDFGVAVTVDAAIPGRWVIDATV
jgi:hypothetical protein